MYNSDSLHCYSSSISTQNKDAIIRDGENAHFCGCNEKGINILLLAIQVLYLTDL